MGSYGIADIISSLTTNHWLFDTPITYMLKKLARKT
jgi:hypothetical protein